MSNASSKIKLKVHFLIQQSGKVSFLDGNKGYEILKARKKQIMLLKELSVGIEKFKLQKLTIDDREVALFYRWLEKKNWISYDYNNVYTNNLNERNYEYLTYIHSNPTYILEKMKDLSIAILGCGGTGSVIAQNLIGMGFQTLSLVDYDKIECSNLNRQIIYSNCDLGKYKSEVLSQKLKLINDKIRVLTFTKRISSSSDLEEIFKETKPNFVICAIDTPPILAKTHVATFCAKMRIPCIFGSVGIESGHYGPLLEKDNKLIVFMDYLSAITKKYQVDEINIIRGSLCPVNSIIASLISMDVFKWFSDQKPLSLNRIIKIDLSSGLIHNQIVNF